MAPRNTLAGVRFAPVEPSFSRSRPFMARKITTCGVLVMNDQRELLLGHATGAKHWDIFKGVGDPGETPIETAVRETSEESGLSLDLAVLCELGLYPYLPAKDLHLFATLIERIDP